MNLYLAATFAFVISFFSTPAVIYLAKRWKILDYPTRSHPAILHSKPTPRSGGLPILISLLVSYFIFAPVDKHIMAILFASCLVVFIGLLDDKFDLNPYVRFGGNLICAAIVVGAGVGITWITNPFDGQIRFDQFIINFTISDQGLLSFFGGVHAIIVLADILALIWIVWIMNALNWSSGVDGQLSGVATIGAAFLGVVALKYLRVDSTQIPVATLSFVTAGAYFGFLPWSFYPQKIMPGYGGATLAGFLLATISILAGGKLATAILILAIPLIDSIWAMVRRLVVFKSPFLGDKLHFHHRLIELGWSKRKIAFFYWTICVLFGLIALQLDSRGKFFAIATIGVITFAVLITTAFILRKVKINAKTS